MASGRTMRAGTPPNSGARQRFEQSSGGSVSSDDDEEGGTSLAELAPETPPHPDSSNTEAPRYNTGEIGLRRHRPIPGTMFNASGILDWFLGRRTYLFPENSADDVGPRAPEGRQDVDDDYFDIGDVKDICPACTTSYCQAVDSIPFQTSLKLMYNDPVSQKWLIGDKYVLHEAVDDHPEDEYVPLVEACRALKTLAPDVPTPKVRAGWKENGKVITISDTVLGERLYDIWWDLSGDEREHIAEQVAQYVSNWRETDLGRISSLTGGPVYHHGNLFGASEEGFGPFGSDLDLWHAIEQRLERKGIDEDTIQLLRDHMPPSSPCVFTHGDLSSANILVHNGEVSAITGFGNSASLPVWAENVSLHFCSCVEDEQWKALLSKHTRNHRAALDWWSLWTAAEDGGVDDDARLESLKARCERWRKTEILGQPFWSVWLGHGGGASRRMNIQPAENAVEARVGELVRRAVGPDLRYEDLSDDSSWGCSSDEEQRDRSEDDEGGAARGEERETRADAVSSDTATAPFPRDAPKRGSLREERRSYAPIAVGDPLGTDSESSSVESTQSRPQSRERPDSSAGVQSKPQGLRPLSLPAFAISERARAQLRNAGEAATTNTSPTTQREESTALRPIREDSSDGKSASQNEGDRRSLPRREKRASMFKNRARPGSLYAALSAASTETRPRRPARSRSEERTASDDAPTDTRTDASRTPRPQSMLVQPAPRFRHERTG
ncbi:hypothetical protein GQX73_g9672 [Xylaria multiplex]|uniref:Aminoglycoside phosphotransferase domain-containing protein n=1 Tax=Xylaria multiplex TaxID=323545 RepID=A0A7C8MM70_9PEZI|nr:hypothetical protein GQX73_g9672 [Xylaria multiplex]